MADTRMETFILKGKPVQISVFTICNHNLVISGKYIKVASIKEEWDEDVIDPERLISEIKSKGLKADIFTFMQRLPESKSKFDYPMEWDNVAALPISEYESWFQDRLHRNHRNKVKLAKKRGVTVRQVDFDDEFIHGIQQIYNETPIRQGRPYWNYGMDFQNTKLENSLFLERSLFLGAFWEDKLIGYIRLVFTNRFARTMGIISMLKHQDKAPTNLLMAKAVEMCAERGVPYLVYAKYDYGKVGSDSLMNFKKYNGFESIILPRYFVPLSFIGRIVLLCSLHHGIKGMIPKKGIRLLKVIRAKWYNIRDHK